MTELGVYRILLATNDAHGVYAGIGFTPLTAPENMMELTRPRPAVTQVTTKEPRPSSPLTVRE